MRYLRITIVFIILLFVGGFFYISTEVNIQQWLIGLLQNGNSNQALIILIIFGLTLVSTLTGLPVLYLSVALGFFFPFFPGLALAWAINLMAIMSTYYMVRRIYADSFRARYGRKKVIRRINKGLEKYGFWTIALSRSVYIIPTNLINFSFPLSRISGRQYILGTMIGLLPESFINVASGYLLKHELLLMNSSEQNILKIGLIGVFLLILISGFLFLRYRRKHKKRDRISDIIPLLEEE